MASLVQAYEAPALDCKVGPVARQYGGTGWLVYSCSDTKSFVVVTADGSPATPFYFFFLHSDKGYQLRGEGNGNKSLTDAAFNDVKQLTEPQIDALLDETRKVAVPRT
jgi:hypothetical protein